MKTFIKIAVLLMLVLTIFSCRCTKYNKYDITNLDPEWALVKDDSTAIKIAEAIWLPIFGESIYNERPYKVKLENGIWHIEGNDAYLLEKGMVGGTVYIKIFMFDGEIIDVGTSK